MHIEKQYLDVMREILTYGERRNDRTGTGTYSLFGKALEHDVGRGFPLLTTKKVHFRSVAWELLWFLHGSPNAKWLQDKGVTIWDEWADPTGYLGPVYGKQWRALADNTNPSEAPTTIDQIADLVDGLKRDPYSRRHIVDAWTVSDLPYMALPPCHMMFQCYVGDGGYLDMQMYQRSADWFLGVPFNLASYALLMHLLGIATGLRPRKLRMVFGDAHIYTNHRRQALEQLARVPLALPGIDISPRVNFTDYDADRDFRLVEYRPHPSIPAPISV